MYCKWKNDIKVRFSLLILKYTKGNNNKYYETILGSILECKKIISNQYHGPFSRNISCIHFMCHVLPAVKKRPKNIALVQSRLDWLFARNIHHRYYL